MQYQGLTARSADPERVNLMDAMNTLKFTGYFISGISNNNQAITTKATIPIVVPGDDDDRRQATTSGRYYSLGFADIFRQY